MEMKPAELSVAFGKIVLQEKKTTKKPKNITAFKCKESQNKKKLEMKSF